MPDIEKDREKSFWIHHNHLVSTKVISRTRIKYKWNHQKPSIDQNISHSKKLFATEKKFSNTSYRKNNENNPWPKIFYFYKYETPEILYYICFSLILNKRFSYTKDKILFCLSFINIFFFLLLIKITFFLLLLFFK